MIRELYSRATGIHLVGYYGLVVYNLFRTNKPLYIEHCSVIEEYYSHTNTLHDIDPFLHKFITYKTKTNGRKLHTNGWS